MCVVTFNRYLRELENEGYIPDTQLRTVYVKAGETTLVEWENTPITGQIQIVKKSADYNPTNGLPAGTLLEGAVFEIYDKAGNLVDTIRSDSRGLAVSKPLPLSRYTIREVKAPANYGVNETELTAYLEHEGQIVKFEVTNKSLTTGVSITKTGPKEIMAGQPVRYTFSGIANSSNVRLDNFYWRDTLPAEVRLDTVVTGTYNFPGTYMPISRPVPCLPGVFKYGNPQNRIHLTEKPLQLMRDVVKITEPGGRILDPFAGSGSTVLAAVLEGYSATGIEVTDAYAALSKERIARELALGA